MITANECFLNALNGCVSDNLKDVFNELLNRASVGFFKISEEYDIDILTSEEWSYIKRYFERAGFSFDLKVVQRSNEFDMQKPKFSLTISV